MIERGKRMPELGALVDFADFYGVSLDYLLGRAVAWDDNQLSVQLRNIVENLDVQDDEEGAEAADMENEAECRENKEMLICLLKQSAVLARRMEKMEQEKTCAKTRNMV